MFYFIFLYLIYAIPDTTNATAINAIITSFTPVCGKDDAVDLFVVIVFGVFSLFVSFFTAEFVLSFLSSLFVVLSFLSSSFLVPVTL